MVRGDQVGHEGGAEDPGTGNKNFDRKYKRHSEAIKDFSVREKSGINDGIVYDRSCTDFFFLILMIVTFLGIFGLAIYALVAGNPDKFIAPYDAAGRLCGFQNTIGEGELVKDVSGLPYLYFTELTPHPTSDLDVKVVLASGVCVRECPDATKIDQESFWKDDCEDASEQGATKGVYCPKVGDPNNYASTAVLKYCVPAFTSEDGTEEQTFYEKLTEEFYKSEAGKVVVDLTRTWKTNLVLIFTGLIVSFLFMWLMSKCARCLALFGVAVMLLSFFGGGAACLYMGLTGSVSTAVTDQSTTNMGLIITGGVLLFFGLCTACCIWCNRTSLETAIAIIDASADFMIDTKRLILVSVFYFILTMIIFFMWLFSVACVFSLLDFKPSPIPVTQLKEIDGAIPGKIWAMFAFLLFGMLWVGQFIGDKTKYITMVAAATYYFDSGPNKVGSASVSTAFSFAYMKNCGSLALGSLVLTLVGILRAIVENLANSAKEDGDGAAKLIACLAKCLMACLESIIEHLSKLAYAYMAVAGDSFCESAWNGFILNLKHLAKFVFAIQIAGMFVFMGVITITCVNTGLGYVLASYVIKDAADATSIVPSLVAFALCSMIVAGVFLGTFDEAVLATLVCFAVDADLHDGQPKFGPPSYHQKLSAIYDFGDKSNEYSQPLMNGQGATAGYPQGTTTGQYPQQNQMY